MKFTYDFIKENLRIYNEAKSLLPIITKFENGEVTMSSMRTLKLDKFAEFYTFMSVENNNGRQPIQAISFKELKSLIVEKTKNDRFKKLLGNITQTEFKKLFNEDIEKFDRYLNGRWISKPSDYSRRRRYGRRSVELAEGLNLCFTQIINYLITNDIETSDKYSNTFRSFRTQDVYISRIKWYTEVVLSLDTVPRREVDVTVKLLNSLVDFIGDAEIDFRKLNSDFIVETFSAKIRSLMVVPTGTNIVSLVDLDNGYGRKVLTKDKTYIVEGCLISNGFLRVLIKDDLNYGTYYDYKLFEDISLQRDMLLSQLGII